MLTAQDFTEDLDDDFVFCVLPEPTNEPADPFAGAERCEWMVAVPVVGMSYSLGWMS